MLNHATPLIRVKAKELAALGVRRVARVTGVRDGLPVLEDGQVLDVANVVWCTGFHPGFSWIDLPVFNERREAIHDAAWSRARRGCTSSGSTSCTPCRRR